MIYRKSIIRFSGCIIVIAFLISISLEFYFYKGNNKITDIDTVYDINQIVEMNISKNDLKKIYDFCNEKNKDFPKFLSRFMLTHHFVVESVGDDLNSKYYKRNTNKEIAKIYECIFNDIECFPVKSNRNAYYYINSFLAPRSYGGERQHLGTDIMDVNNVKGNLSIVSMTSGKIENMGWNELGGYRIGIRSDEGTYFYYAHLDSYEPTLKIGDKIKSGDLLGFMGNTGYGEEGTEDQFDVHLHIGIALNYNGEEVWINPYPILGLYELNE